ncbi:putative RNA-binding Zn ribbon-like protein [Nocardia tenerifensis]|uniref:Putative RNA-binding Zn ribbon-like protein n=1 Tax=Nocardia tenerifensis TaxID=228006 RepID=A0A318JVE0_9NOCA|nr:CGNR zinc finger domain-containing protein [Nocardia tenerifensis]PXX58148.1 putative RNA-binding Zn ribbon-like protein [Nocardia tenerifensis]
MRLDSHTLGAVQFAVRLINAVVPGERRGRAYPAAAGQRELRDRISGVVPPIAGFHATPADAPGLARVAAQLRQVFAAVASGDMDAAAERTNAMMHEYDARPVLTRDPGRPWHLRFHTPDAPRVPAIGAAVTVAVASVLGSEHADRIGVCSAPTCDRVYLDLTRNGTKRFCGTACQNRAKNAAFRARQQTWRP